MLEACSRIDVDKPEMDMKSPRGFDHAHLACKLPTSSDDRSAPSRAFQWADLKSLQSAGNKGFRIQLYDGFPVDVPLKQCRGSSEPLSHSPSFVQTGEKQLTQ